MFCVDCGEQIPDGGVCEKCNPKKESFEGKNTPSNSTTADEITLALHRNKSFVLQGLLALVLYYVGFYVLGLISNFLFLSQAKKTREIIDGNPPGFIFLKLILWIHFTVPLILGVLALIAFLDGI